MFGLGVEGGTFRERQKPAQRILEHAGAEGVDDELAVLFRGHQAGPLQQVEVMGDCGFAEAEVIGNRSGGKVSLAQQVENRAAGVVIESLENRGHGDSIVRQISK